MVLGFQIVLSDETNALLPSLHDLLDDLSRRSEASSSAMKDLQSKLDVVSAECLAEKEKVITLLEMVAIIQLFSI